MEPKNATVSELFNNDFTYVVRRYQRLYVWNEEDQWAPLWEDVVNIASKVHSCIEDQENNGAQIEPHFFGTLVLKSSGSTPDEMKQLRVIDGQQRLTTLQLMIAAVADELREHAIIVQSIEIAKLTQNSNNRLKVTHGSEHYSGFAEAILPGDDKTIVPGSMGKCYLFFRKVTEHWLNSGQDSDIENRAGALLTTIQDKLQVVVIYLDRQEEEHKIFETLNARGVPLTEWDKIKNFLLYKADDLTDIGQDQYYRYYLEYFDQSWWREDFGRGIGRRPRSDVFAQYWLTSEIMKSVGSKRVFKDFQHYVNERKMCLISLGKQLTSDAQYYRKYEQESSQTLSSERNFHNRRLRLNQGAWWPLIFELNRKFKQFNYDDLMRKACFDCLESFLFRRIIIGYQARSYDSIVLSLLAVIKEISVRTDQLESVISTTLSIGQSVDRVWPKDDELEDAILDRKIPAYVQKVVLETIEQHIMPPDAGYTSVPRDLEIEHIMPVSWQSHDWPISNDSSGVETVEERDALIHTLGNLTLIRSGLNKRLGNRSWNKKRQLITQSDNLFMNKHLLQNSVDSWDTTGIQNRGRWIAEQVQEIWKYPSD